MHLIPVAAAAAAWLLTSQATAQGIGSADTHPKLTTSKCTLADGCVPHSTSLVLDASFHPLRAADPSSTTTTTSTARPCGGYGGAAWDEALCPDRESCARNCVFDGAEYEGNGVAANGSELVLRQYMQRDGVAVPVSPRVYLLDEEGDGEGEKGEGEGGNYAVLHLRNQEISFDVDVSKLVCGMNGAMYLAEMNATGARSALNPAGAAYGTGYCNAQCPVLPFINGEANLDSHGSCCSELDLWEANSVATALTPHTCSAPGVFACAGAECGSLGNCDKSGCPYNPYKLGNSTFYGPGSDTVIDTSRPFTVTTQFLESMGVMNEIRRTYVQDGRTIPNARVPAASPTVPPGDSIKMSHCQAVGAMFEELGGLAQMGRALDRGMVLVFSIWNDDAQFMNWLDSAGSGPCTRTEGDPELIRANHADTEVTFSNIRWGDLGSTTLSL
ncbi:glycoside hydrolase family 7 protein [Whalleya microplaca]|nr:glycoside hydrolase family 7 protein [Whalleya microplaca]